MNIFVSNLSVSAHKNHLKNLFSEFGMVRSVVIIKAYLTKKTPASCCLVIDNRKEAENAIRNLNHTKFMDKIIGVSEAKLRV